MKTKKVIYFLNESSQRNFGENLIFLCKIKGNNGSRKLCEYLSKRYQGEAFLYQNGRSALAAAIMATTPKGSKVLVSDFSCWAVVQAVLAAKCVPVYADINQENFHFGEAELRKALVKNPDIKTMVLQNTFGLSLAVEPILEIAKLRKIAVIEDLAHAAGREYAEGLEMGKVGAATVFSFGKGKAIDRVAGGALVLRDKKLTIGEKTGGNRKFIERLRIRCYPIINYWHNKLVANEVRKGDQKKIRWSKIYMGIMLGLKLVSRSADDEVNLVRGLPDWQADLILADFKKLSGREKPLRRPVVVKNRTRAILMLEEMGIVARDFWYERPISPERYYQKMHFPEEDCPNATKLARGILNLPGYLGERQIDKIKRELEEV